VVELQMAADKATEAWVQARIDACVEAAVARVMLEEAKKDAARAKADVVICVERERTRVFSPNALEFSMYRRRRRCLIQYGREIE